MRFKNAARLKARYATLLDHFHLTLDGIAKLTDLQIDELYFHERDEETGEIRPVGRRAKADTLEDELLTLDGLHEALPGGIEDIERVKEMVRIKWRERS